MTMNVEKQVTAQVQSAVTQTVAKPEVAAQMSAAPAIIDAVMSKILPSILHATSQEPWYQSRVFWSAMLSIVAAIAGIFGLTIDQDQQAEILKLIFAVLPAVSAGLALYARYFAKKPLGQ